MDYSLLEDNAIRLRRCEPGDASDFYRWESTPSIAMSNTLCEPISLFQAEQLVSLGSSSLQENGFLYLVIEQKGDHAIRNAIGYIMLYNYDFANARSYIGIAIDERYRRKGYALRSISLMSRYANSVFRIERLIAEITPTNLTARSLFEKAGFRLIATLPEWIRQNDTFTDLLLYALCPTPQSNK